MEILILIGLGVLLAFARGAKSKADTHTDALQNEGGGWEVVGEAGATLSSMAFGFVLVAAAVLVVVMLTMPAPWTR